MKHVRAKVVGVFFLVLVIGAVAAGSATAAEPRVKSDCPLGKACLWEGPTYGGNRAFFSEEKGCHSLANITPHSWYNHMSGGFMAFKPSNGTEFLVFTGESFNNQPGFSGTMCINFAG
jgi:hypothetical protein